jgi:hypothetical protein
LEILLSEGFGFENPRSSDRRASAIPPHLPR